MIRPEFLQFAKEVPNFKINFNSAITNNIFDSHNDKYSTELNFVKSESSMIENDNAESK